MNQNSSQQKVNVPEARAALDNMKFEIARELGILDKVLENGWKSLSAKETGRIGGMMARKKK